MSFGANGAEGVTRQRVRLRPAPAGHSSSRDRDGHAPHAPGSTSPPARLRIELERLRAGGQWFEQAWPGALEHAVADAPHAEQWRQAITWARPWFQDAFVRRGPARLAAAVEARELAEIVAEQVRAPAGAGGHRLVA